MILLGCNYHEETEELVKKGKIDIDFYKFPSLGYQMDVFWSPELMEFKELMKRLQQSKPVYLHGLNPSLHNIGSETFIQDLDVNIVKELIQICDLKGISVHLDGCEQQITKDKLVKRIRKNISYLKSEFNELQFISLENVNLIRSPHVSEPDIISEVIRTSEADFLLDISHAFIAARNYNMSAREYMKKLPLDRVYEIHINGWEEKDSDIMSHTKINGIAYELLDEVLQLSTPKLVTIEYGRYDDRINCGCPVMQDKTINTRAMDEIVEQVEKVRHIIY